MSDAKAPETTTTESTKAQIAAPTSSSSSEIARQLQEQQQQMEKLQKELESKNAETMKYKESYEREQAEKRKAIQAKVDLVAKAAHRASAMNNFESYAKKYEGKDLSAEQILEIALRDTPAVAKKFEALAQQAETNPEIAESLTMISAYAAHGSGVEAEFTKQVQAMSAKDKELAELRARLAAVEGGAGKLAEENRQLAEDSARMAEVAITQSNAALRNLQKEASTDVETRKRPRRDDDVMAHIRSGEQLWLVSANAALQYPGRGTEMSPRVNTDHIDQVAATGLGNSGLAESVQKAYRVAAIALPPQGKMEAPAAYINRIAMTAAISDAKKNGNTTTSGFAEASDGIFGKGFRTDETSGKVIVKDLPAGFDSTKGERRRVALERLLGGPSME